ncbi:MAG TPA: glucose-1-phosphate adenylyltransferase [Chitinophagaceae bacterium]|nr:glucose-1-phosphate adenylyltransferase [Chitinophagaceae bacterium]
MSNSVICVILGGGQGTRLYPLTRSRSKPAVPIAGKYRLVDIPISNCLNSGLKRIFVLTQFNSASLNKHIKNAYHFDQFNSGFVDILAAEQTPDNPKWYQGTADAVRQCMHHITNYDSDYVLILSGDQLYQMDFQVMIENHIKKEAEITIATIPVGRREASDFGIMKTDDEHFITSFIEKPKGDILLDWSSDVGEEMKKEGRIYLASMGIYLFNKNLLFEILNSNKEAADFGKEVIPQSIGKHKIIGYQYDGYWTDIGNIYSFFEANLGLTDDIPLFNLFDNDKTIYSRSRMLPPAKISGTTLEKTLIADGCIIQASRIEHSLVGIRTRIGSGTTIVNSYLMGNDKFQTIEEIEQSRRKGIPAMGIGERCYIRNTIVDKNCCIGNDVRINGGNHLADGEFDSYVVKDGVVVMKKGAVLPDGFTL